MSPTLQALLLFVHLVGVVVWVGGMVFAHFFLRPAVAALEPAVRLRLMHDVLGRFFRAVLVAALFALYGPESPSIDHVMHPPHMQTLLAAGFLAMVLGLWETHCDISMVSDVARSRGS